MTLPKKELLKKSKNPEQIAPLLNQAESALKTWSYQWSPFISAPICEEALKIMAPLNNIHWHSDGGYPGAERQRMQCICHFDSAPFTLESAPITGMRIEGNFLFDRATPQDFRRALEMLDISPNGVGDIWITGDRGAQALCTPEAAKALNGAHGLVRDVEIFCEAVEISQLQLPFKRAPKKSTTVEASTRIDAIASAGFGLSRAKIVSHIKDGRLRLNWRPLRQSSKQIQVGDRIQLESKGTVEVLKINLTKRNRWRVELLRE